MRPAAGFKRLYPEEVDVTVDSEEGLPGGSRGELEFLESHASQ
jgi:hypothetical protein